MPNLMDVAAFRAALHEHRKPVGGVFRASVSVPKAAEDGSRKVRFCFSDGSVDRMGDTIDPAGWELRSFLNNPVALFGHDSSSPPIGRASSVGPEGGRLMGDIEFAPPEIYEFADTIYRLVVGKYLNSVSVGFLPLEYSFVDNDPERGWGIDFKRQELLEISVVPVPANGNALGEARAKGIDTRPLVEWAERTLDGGGKVVIPRSELERLRKAAKETPMRTQRRAAKPRFRADGGTEGDPAAGVASCGRGVDDACGMTDPGECSVHGSGRSAEDEAEDKRLSALISRAVAEGVRRALAGRRRDAADGGAEGGESIDRPDLSEDGEKCIRMAHMHMKAMGDALEIAEEHHDKAMDALETVKDALDAAPPPDPADDPDAEKAAQVARVKALRTLADGG
jgi:hypothetical protein